MHARSTILPYDRQLPLQRILIDSVHHLRRNAYDLVVRKLVIACGGAADRMGSVAGHVPQYRTAANTSGGHIGTSGQKLNLRSGDLDGAGAMPIERLDILTGRLRIRELPLPANENSSLQT